MTDDTQKSRHDKLNDEAAEAYLRYYEQQVATRLKQQQEPNADGPQR